MELTLAILLALVVFIGVPAVIGCALVGFRAWCGRRSEMVVSPEGDELSLKKRN